MIDRVPREWHKLKFVSAKRLLVGLQDIATRCPLHELRYAASSLRTRELRQFGEGRQAALFCYGMGQAIGTTVDFAQNESKDYDIVARFVKDGKLNYVPVQLKEWVPEFLNSASTLQSELDKLEKYVDSHDLVVAFHLNREATVYLLDLRCPEGRVAEIWLYGALSQDQIQWVMIGNLLRRPATNYAFSYPSVD